MTENHGPGATSAFLEALYGTADDDLWLLVWNLPGKQSQWISVQNLDTVGERAQTIAGNVYLGAGLLSMPGRPDERGERNDIAGIPGVWADIDYGSEGHQKSNLPPTMLDAARLIAELPAKPTVLVHSGHGFQAWWLFHEFWRFEDDDERDRAEALLRGWQTMIRSGASQHGWTIDSTWDLPRVLRLPGTWNVKREPRQPVRLDELHDDLRYGIEELEQLCPTDTDHAEAEPVMLSDLPSEPPFMKFQNLYANDEEFKRLWEHRKKLPDDSLSGYDMALANVAVKAAWSDEEIVGLLIAHRRYHNGGTPKHKSYYERTIGKARVGLEQTRADIELAETLADMRQPGKEPSREEILDLISKHCGVRVTRFIKVGTDMPIYYLETERGTFNLGTSLTLDQQGRFRTKMIEVAGKRPRTIRKDDDWTTFVNRMLEICEEESAGNENTEAGAITEWLKAYLYFSRAPLEWDEIEQAVRSRTPFISREGDLCIFSAALRSFINEREGERVRRNELPGMLRRVGCHDRVFTFQTSDGRTTSTSAWIVPDSVYRSGTAPTKSNGAFKTT